MVKGANLYVYEQKIMEKKRKLIIRKIKSNINNMIAQLKISSRPNLIQ